MKLSPMSSPTLFGLLGLLLTPTADGQSYPEECRNYAPPAVIKGNKIFVSTTGEYLPIKGINYYPRPNAGDLTNGNSQDYFTEEFRSSWERDIAQFIALGVNAIRLYAVNPGLNHDAFMCALKAAGIYVIVGLAADCEDCAIQSQEPPTCYPSTLKDRGEFIIQQFARYENVLGFSAGNEVSLSAESYMGNLPCQKKFIRDMRAYVQQCTATNSMRHIPVGVVYADNGRAIQAQYFNCRSNPEDELEPVDELENAEFIGINTYLHCDGAATDSSQLVGYQTLLQDFLSYGMTVPVMWTEFGCLNPSFETMDGFEAQRNFLQVDALFSPEYREVFNGGLVFEYSTEKVYSEQTSPYPFTSYGSGNYGVGYFSPENCNEVDIPCVYNPFPQFQTLANRYAAVDASTMMEATLDSYIPPARDLPACPPDVPPVSAFDWPTDTMASTQVCPVLVPVYCLGVPPECVTVVLTGQPLPTNQTSSPTVTMPLPSGNGTDAQLVIDGEVIVSAPSVGPLIPDETMETTSPSFASSTTPMLTTSSPTATTEQPFGNFTTMQPTGNFTTEAPTGQPTTPFPSVAPTEMEFGLSGDNLDSLADLNGTMTNSTTTNSSEMTTTEAPSMAATETLAPIANGDVTVAATSSSYFLTLGFCHCLTAIGAILGSVNLFN